MSSLGLCHLETDRFVMATEPSVCPNFLWVTWTLFGLLLSLLNPNNFKCFRRIASSHAGDIASIKMIAAEILALMHSLVSLRPLVPVFSRFLLHFICPLGI